MTHQLLILGVLLTLSMFTVAPPPPGYVISENFPECQKKADELMEPIMECISQEFTPEHVNETRRLYNASSCLPCKHFCRKQEHVKGCLSQGVQVTKDLSNKSKTMVPFTFQLAEATLNALCDNEEEMFPDVTDEEVRCLRDSWETCNSDLEFLGQLEGFIFCDSGNPETDPLTKEYMCQKLGEFLDCTKESVTPCSASLVNTFTILKRKLVSSDSCAKNK